MPRRICSSSRWPPAGSSTPGWAAESWPPARPGPFAPPGTSGFEAQGGKSGGCGVPIGASSPVAAAVMINLVAIDVAGKGNLAAWEFGQPEPVASSINFQKIDMNIANGLIVPITGVSSQAADLNVKANFNNAHLVADVTGYFTRFPVENFQGGLKSSLQTNDFTTLINLGDGACHELNSCTFTTAVPGTVVVEAWGQFVMEHTAGTLDRVAIGVETAATVSCLDPDSVNASDYEVPASLGSNPDVDFTISHGVAFTQPGRNHPDLPVERPGRLRRECFRQDRELAAHLYVHSRLMDTRTKRSRP